MVTPSENEKGYRVSIVRCMMIDGNIMAGFVFFSLPGFVSFVSSQSSC